ncbi:MAG: hypothetical protein JNK55_00825 [Rubrivivax sp.]|nr:hypothetical protein [Rubrivivax sp.]
MKRSAEVQHLFVAYRDFDSVNRDRLVRHMLEVACTKLNVPSNDLDAIVVASLAARRNGTAVQQAAGRAARWCVSWLEGKGMDLDFASAALWYAQLDPRGGRPEGAIAEKTRYVIELKAAHPGLSAKQLLQLALTEAQRKVTPFGNDDGTLYEIATEKTIGLRAWEKLVSAAKNPKKR